MDTTRTNMNLISAEELYDTTFRPPCRIIDGFLTSGLNILAGAPKTGKSFLVRQIAYHVATGTDFWGFSVCQGAVLYLALEDSCGRLQRRFMQSFGEEVEFGDRLYFATEAKTLKQGLIDEMEGFVEEHQNTKLIIIDPLQFIRDSTSTGLGYAEDYEAMSALKRVSDRYGICILLVHHTRKKEATDSFLKIAGTTGVFGAVDGAFVLSKDRRTDNTASLEYVGRDMPDQNFRIEFDRQKLIWDLKTVDRELWKSPPDPVLEAISSFLTDNNSEWKGTSTELISVANLDSGTVKPNTLTRKLNASVGKLRDEYQIEYFTGREKERFIYLKRLPDRS